MKKGKLIVFEGSDGSGKATQSRLLSAFFKKQRIPYEFIAFPRYKESWWGKMVERYLKGEFGGLSDVNPYLASTLYAGDRASAAPKIRKWLNSGKIVVCDRYIGSNIVHMAAKIKNQNERSKFTRWLEDLEYRENGIPREDLVIFLHVPVEVSRQLIKSRRLDIHEADLDYLGKVTDVYRDVARSKNYWEMIGCTHGGKILPPAVIHKKVLQILRKRKILD